jgi:hypothetical protein
MEAADVAIGATGNSTGIGATASAPVLADDAS